MTPERHSEMSRKVRETLLAVRGETVPHVAAELAKVVDREYAVAEAVSAANHWKETFLNLDIPAEVKNEELDGCRLRHAVWAKVVEFKTPKF